ncbi:hypothetical protein ACLB2K_033037 [Fragaria x ananassa]
MEVDGGKVLKVSSGAAQSVPRHSRKHKAFYQFTQQSLPACKPILTPPWVITTFLLMGVIFIPLGLITLHASENIVEIVDRYDNDCVPEAFRSNKVAYIKNNSIPKNCSRYLKVYKHMKAPINIYYQLDNYYQNHRRYVKSKNDEQLLHGLGYNDTSSCKPEDSNNDLPVVPCGLIAWSLFNDTYTLIRGRSELKVNRKNVAWKSDRDHKFGKNVYPFNFQNGTLMGGGKLDPRIPLSDQEDLIVWMRTAALPSFRKLLVRRKEQLPWVCLHFCWFKFHIHLYCVFAAPHEKSQESIIVPNGLPSQLCPAAGCQIDSFVTTGIHLMCTSWNSKNMSC